MSGGVRVAVAPNFHLPGAAAERVLDAGAAPADPTGGLVLLFAVPGHLRASFWDMMDRAEAGQGFDGFAAEVGRFLAFKQLPPPERAVFELVLHGPGGGFEGRDLWAVVNLGEESVVVGLPGLRLRLGPGEGCVLPEGVAAEVLPPEGEVPDVLLAVRRPGE
jgi:hypothetical protein